MRNRISLLSAGLGLLLALPLSAQNAQEAGAKVQKGKAVAVGSQVRWVADYPFRTTNGEEIRMSEWFKPKSKDAKAGEAPKVLVLTFWSASCPWQQAWDPELKAIQADYAAKGVKVVGINSNHTETAEKTKKHVKSTGLNFPVLMDPGSKVAHRFGARTTPHIYMIDAKGNVLFTGAIDNDAKKKKAEDKRRHYLRDALDETLAGKPVTTSVTKPQGCTIKFAPATPES